MAQHRSKNTQWNRNVMWRGIAVLGLVGVGLVLGGPVFGAGSSTSVSCTRTSTTLTCPDPRVTVTVTATPSASPTTTAPTSSTPPTDTPTPTPTDTSTTPPPPPGNVTGQDITTANTGQAAWRGENGEACILPTIYTSVVKASSLGQSVRCAEFKQGVTFDQDIIITASKFDASIDTNGHTVTLNYDTIAPSTVEDICVHGDGTFLLFRSQVSGCSDAVRFEGDSIIESWLRTKAGSSQDHNDAIQAYQAGSGGSILRSNIDAKPVNAAQYGIAGGNGAIFLADNSKGTTEIRDNYLQGGGYTLRLNESMHYRVTGNVIAKCGYLFGPLDTTNSVNGAFLEWSGNSLSDGTPLPLN